MRLDPVTISGNPFVYKEWMNYLVAKKTVPIPINFNESDIPQTFFSKSKLTQYDQKFDKFLQVNNSLNQKGETYDEMSISHKNRCFIGWVVNTKI